MFPPRSSTSSPPTPFIQAAEQDAFIPIAEVREAFSRAEEPKRLEVFPVRPLRDIQPACLRDQAIDAQVAWAENEHLQQADHPAPSSPR